MYRLNFLKSKKSLVIALSAILGLAFCPPPSNPWVTAAQGDSCNTAVISGGYTNDMKQVKAVLSVDGNPLDTQTGVGTAYVGYSGPMAAGNHVAVVDGYVWEKTANSYYIYDNKPELEPESWTCPTVSWSYKWGMTTYSIVFTYDKDASDPHKCHRPSDSALQTLGSPKYKDWPGSVKSKFKQDNPESINATYNPPVYGKCSDLGEGWENNPGHSNCRKLMPASYDWVWKTNAKDSFTVAVCHTSVMIDVGTCEWREGDKSVTPVGVSMDEGVLQVEITGPDGFDVVLTENGSVDTEKPSVYNWVATAAPGFELDGPAEGSFITKACPPMAPECPKCEPRKDQPVVEGRLRINMFGITPCHMVNGCQEFQEVVRLTTVGVRPRLIIPATCNPDSGKCKIVEGTLRKGANGVTYGSLVYYIEDPYRWNFKIVGEDGRWLGETLKFDWYGMCMVMTTYADTDESGNAYWTEGTNINEWELFLIREGYFKYGEKTAIDAWITDLSANKVWPLPSKPAA
jgi:hypothetical protein